MSFFFRRFCTSTCKINIKLKKTKDFLNKISPVFSKTSYLHTDTTMYMNINNTRNTRRQKLVTGQYTSSWSLVLTLYVSASLPQYVTKSYLVLVWTVTILTNVSQLNHVKLLLNLLTKFHYSWHLSPLSSEMLFYEWKTNSFGVFLERILPHLKQIWRDAPIPLYSVRMREKKDQKNSEYGHFSRSGYGYIRNIVPSLLFINYILDRSTLTPKVQDHFLSNAVADFEEIFNSFMSKLVSFLCENRRKTFPFPKHPRISQKGVTRLHEKIKQNKFRALQKFFGACLSSWQLLTNYLTNDFWPDCIYPAS